MDKPLLSHQAVGWLAVFGSAFCFYLATTIIRWGSSYIIVSTSFYVFGRFLLGFMVVCATMLIGCQRLAPNNYHLLFGRTIANTIAVFCFYKAIEVGTVAEANILNMTYPLFVALFSWFFLKKQRDVFALLIVGVAFIGIWMILSPAEKGVNWGNLWGLSSGIVAAIAMVYLNLSRQYHDSQTILFFMFGIGSVVIYLLFHEEIHWPNMVELIFLFTCSLAGVLGQYLLTYGYLYVTAVEGSIISSSRILLAALFGPFLVGDPALTAAGWCGALLIFGANSFLALGRRRIKSL